MATEFKLSYTASDINERLGRIDSFATKSELPKNVSDLVNDSDFATKNYIQGYAQPKGDYALRSEIPTDYLTEIPEEYITEDELNSKGYLTEHQSLEDFVTNEALAQAIADVKADSANKDAVVLAEVQKGIEDAKKDASNKNAVVLAEAQKGINANAAAIETKAAQADLDAAVERIGANESKIGALETASATHALKTEVQDVQKALDEYKESNDTAVAGKADKATTLAGYGIADAYTKAEVEAMLTWGEF